MSEMFSKHKQVPCKLWPYSVGVQYVDDLPLFKFRVLQSIRKAFPTNADSLQYAVASQLVQD